MDKLIKKDTEIKAVFFDATDTLIHLPKRAGYHYRIVAEHHGLHLDEDALNKAFRESWKRMPGRAMTKMQRADDDKGWWRDFARDVLVQAGGEVSDEMFDAYFEDLYLHFTKPDVWELCPDVRETLSRLDGNYRLGVISNFDKRLRVILDQLEVSGCFEKIFISSEVGADKPDPYIFRHALEVFGLDVDAALHVGDDPRNDWHAAEAIGMRAFRLDRPGNSLTDLCALLMP